MNDKIKSLLNLEYTIQVDNKSWQLLGTALTQLCSCTLGMWRSFCRSFCWLHLSIFTYSDTLALQWCATTETEKPKPSTWD